MVEHRLHTAGVVGSNPAASTKIRLHYLSPAALLSSSVNICRRRQLFKLNPPPITKALRVFFDGSCPICQKEIGIYKNADTTARIHWVDVSAEQASGVLPLARHALLARFHVQTPGGQLISGARGFIEMWRQLPGWRWLARICSIPGAPHILEIGYCGFLKVRPAIQRYLR